MFVLFVHINFSCVGPKKSTLMSNSHGLGLFFFPWKDGKDVASEGRLGRKGFYFSLELASVVFLVNMLEVFFPIYTLIWRINNYVSLEGKGINRKSESTFVNMKSCTVLSNHFCVLYNSINCC